MIVAIVAITLTVVAVTLAVCVVSAMVRSSQITRIEEERWRQ